MFEKCEINELIDEYKKRNLNYCCVKCNKRENNILIYKAKRKNINVNALIPICENCYDPNISLSNKKNNRHIYSKLGFSSLNEQKRKWFLHITPEERGKKILKYYKKRTDGLKINNQWINNQVKLTTKWIKKFEMSKNKCIM